MMPRRHGVLLFVSSIAGFDPMPGLGAYSVSKAGLNGLVKALAKELGPHGIRVNALAPGLIETRFSSALFTDAKTYQGIVEQTPLGRHGQPQDLIGAALFLVSEASAFVTGQILLVDGGSRV
jgi:NAD(P)-dependent dehydrogenase (short-subunit alcohol dehydrogenase family)